MNAAGKQVEHETGRNMANENQNHEWKAAERDAIDRELNTALAKYSAADPRTGLEDRVLANLRAERENLCDSWPRWTIVTAAALGAMVIVAVTLAWRSERPRHSIATKYSPDAAQTEREPAKQMAASHDPANNRNPPRRQAPVSARKMIQHRVNAEAVAATSPKLDRFPSRQPPGDKELLLARYVRDFPAEAALIARAQDDYEKEIDKRIEAERAENESSGSDLQER
jgi:hypothetical protein